MKVIKHLCPQNHPCPVVSMCPTGAIKQHLPFQAPAIDYSKCTKCAVCTFYCAFGAIQAS